ncbi:MAG: copper resistance protein CopC [Leucobacter sp.]|nr:copper resistance protein CopC [Leucobacter sp.]
MHTHTQIQSASRPPKTIAAIMIAATLGLGFAVFSASAPAQAHDQLIDVEVETTDSGEAAALRLTFSDNVLEVGTEIHVTDPDGGDATNGLPTFSGRDVTQKFATPLSDGNYTSAWRVVSSDGHPIEGGFTFDIDNGQASEVRPYTGEAETAPEQQEESAAEGAESSDSSGLTLPIAIGAAAVVAVAVAIPMIIRMRKSAASAEDKSPRDTKE